MTTLRRALPGLYRKESILAMATIAAVLLVAMLFAGQPVLAMSPGGGGHSGGGGHAGGGSHGGGGGHASAHPIGSGHFVGPARGFGGHFVGGHFVGGHFVGGRFVGGRFFGGGFFPVFGFGFGLGLGLAWDYPWWGPGWYGYPYWYGYNPGYGPYGYPYYPGYPAPGYDSGYGQAPAPGASSSPRDEMGALSLDLSPSDAEVYLDGEYVGRVRDFSGWRSGYLWLKKGTYDIVFYKDGYKTLARQVSIYPGLVIKWDDKMEHGQAVRPEDLQTKTHERRDSRLQFERDRAEQIDRQQQSYDQGQQQGGWNTWQDRVNQDRNGGYAPAPPPPPSGNVPQSDSLARPQPAPGPTLAAATADQYGRLRIKVEPDDASVYLDGRFVGTGSDLAGNEAGLVLAPGHHRISVVRPGHRAEERSIDAVLGKDVDLTVTLAPTGPAS